jgi:hypothetical protein
VKLFPFLPSLRHENRRMLAQLVGAVDGLCPPPGEKL